MTWRNSAISSVLRDSFSNCSCKEKSFGAPQPKAAAKLRGIVWQSDDNPGRINFQALSGIDDLGRYRAVGGMIVTASHATQKPRLQPMREWEIRQFVGHLTLIVSVCPSV
jgi:hypothetical protein